MSWTPSIDERDASLTDLIDWRFPDALWITVDPLSSRASVLWVLDMDYSYTRWLCSLADDGHWTLSPRD